MIESYETVRIKGEEITPDLLIWRRYKRPAPGVLEAFLAKNPQAHAALRSGPYLAVGEVVFLPIDPDILNGRPANVPVVRLWGTV
jgi:phage tail protein X